MILSKKGKKTPYFVYHQENLESTINDFRVFQDNDIKIYYAVKSNTYGPLIKTLVKNNYGFDIASLEETKYVKGLGGNPAEFSFSSPTKLPEEIREASKMGVQYFAFDSEHELLKILKYATNPKLIGRIAVYNEDKSSQDLSGIFGMTTDYYEDILKKAKKYNWPICGLTFHVGSQNTLLSSWEQALSSIENLIELSDKYGIKISCINIGGGIPVPYNESIEPTKHYVKEICQLLLDFRTKHKINELIVEPGRAISANTMTLVTQIVNIKEYKEPPILVVDTSVFNGLIERLEHTDYPIETEGKHNGIEKKVFKISGLSCDGYDVIKEKSLLPENLKIGDNLLIKYAGAYTLVYGNFHMRGYPPIYNKK